MADELNLEFNSAGVCDEACLVAAEIVVPLKHGRHQYAYVGNNGQGRIVPVYKDDLDAARKNPDASIVESGNMHEGYFMDYDEKQTVIAVGFYSKVLEEAKVLNLDASGEKKPLEHDHTKWTKGEMPNSSEVRKSLEELFNIFDKALIGKDSKDKDYSSIEEHKERTGVMIKKLDLSLDSTTYHFDLRNKRPAFEDNPPKPLIPPVIASVETIDVEIPKIS